jgi:hypothetical protein
MVHNKKLLKMLGNNKNPLFHLFGKNLFCTLGPVMKNKKKAQVVYFDPLTAEWVRETATPRSDGSVTVGWEVLGRGGLT